MKVIIGAGEQRWGGWIPTQGEELNLLDENTWEAFFGEQQAEAFLCEHVFEHITVEEARHAAGLIKRYLKTGGFIRLAVPDKHFPNEEYQRTVQVGGPGPLDHPAADHKVVYGYKEFSEVFEQAGFAVSLLEYHDEHGVFHTTDWDVDVAPIFRSSKLDPRNQGGVIGFASIIIDARKTG
ncbi:class I SAM-dependent methyltransferase [Pelagicoccus albus]|uniref:Methyltransferase domain-containing protein n=1 Tax=Pelagicoccus albus TaxID=415222 RepID=A0A7X1B8X4_9BACT|nr:hypothetical protein [Pelagicoccus albus]MBC2607524.1 hypothetical protein [Pelagicoccus albus]